jgi:DNA-directed RNA polymerase specialized sigma24 family protein
MDNHPGPPGATPVKVSSPPPGIRPDRASAPDPDEIADRASRLQADRELRDALAAEGFAGPAYAVFEEDLAGYGYQVMQAWLKTGYIFTLCRQAGLGLTSERVPVGDREDLAQETVAAALNAFKRVGLQRGGWRPEGGASLRTYFIGALCHQFANVWRKRLRTRAVPATLPLEAVPPGAASRGPGPDDIVVQRDEIRRGLVGIESERTRAALVLAAEGYEHEEIAEILGPDVTARAVEGYLRRHRRRLVAGNKQEEAGD